MAYVNQNQNPYRFTMKMRTFHMLGFYMRFYKCENVEESSIFIEVISRTRYHVIRTLCKLFIGENGLPAKY